MATDAASVILVDLSWLIMLSSLYMLSPNNSGECALFSCAHDTKLGSAGCSVTELESYLLYLNR